VDSQTRVQAMTAAIQQLINEAEGYVIFIDRQSPENYVQLNSDGELEVTSRNFRTSRLPRLTETQVTQLVALGFSAEAHPNHRRQTELTDAAAIASMCEQLFSLLGSPPTFDLDTEAGV